MSLVITAVAVGLGVAYAGLVCRRFGTRGWRSPVLLAPVWAVYVVTLLVADTSEPVPRAIQSFALGTIVESVVDLWRDARALRDERRAEQAAVTARLEADVRAANAAATERTEA